MDKVFQVFISSTFTDLQEERRQVSNTLAKAGYVVAGMELFPAADQEQLEYIKRVIDRSDYYVVIVGGRYGSLTDDNVSYTEKEFEYAKSKRIPVLAFLHHDPRNLPVKKTDENSHKAALLEQFRGKLSTGRMRDSWTDAGDLCTKVVIAVVNAVNLTPGVGWIRGDQAVDPSVLQETERLRIENGDLRARLAAIEAEGLLFEQSLLGPSDEVKIRAVIADVNKPPEKTVTNRKTLSLTYGQIYESLYDKLLEEPPEGHVRSSLEEMLWGSFPPAEVANKSVTISSEDFRTIRNQFEALDLIKIISVTHPVPPNSNASFFSSGHKTLNWQVTEKGRKFAISNRALKR
jgi:hypothetical protein